MLGAFLYYKGKANPIEAFKDDVYQIFGLKKTSPRTTNDTEASDSRVPQKEKKEKGILEDWGIKLPEIKDNEQENEPTNETTIEDEGSLAIPQKYWPKSKKGETVEHTAYALNYREEYEQADWVVHLLYGKRKGKAKRSNDFRPDPNVSTGSAEPADYARSGYDRGHLAPAGDFKWDKDLTDETFYMSNMSPQVGDFNQGIWNDLEQLIRRWAGRRGTLVIVTGPVLKSGLETIGRRNEVAVPEQYYKIVYDPATEQAIAFLMNNEGMFDRLLKEFVVSIDEVERKTGIDFFEKLPDNLEQKIEQQSNVDGWFRNNYVVSPLAGKSR
jgi:endonuclease G, mitochondrial